MGYIVTSFCVEILLICGFPLFFCRSYLIMRNFVLLLIYVFNSWGGLREAMLLEEITRKQEELVQTVYMHGLDSKITIQCSQDLDELIIEYQSSLLKVAAC